MPPAKRKTIIIGCSARKKGKKGKARDLYDGPLWQTFRKYSKGNHRVMALSAKYGLISADKQISTYDCLLGRDRTQTELVRQLQKQLKKFRLRNVYVVTSKKYAQALRDAGLKDFKFITGGIGIKRKKLRGLL